MTKTEIGKIDKWKLLEYFLESQLRISGERTFLAREKDISKFLKDFDPFALERLSLQAAAKKIYRWLFSFKQWRKSSTFSQKITSLKKFYDFLIEKGYVKKNPMSLLKEPRFPRRASLAFTPDQLRRVIKVADQTSEILTQDTVIRDKALFFILLTSGLHSTELCKVKKKDIDLKSRTIYIPKQNARKRKEKRVPFSLKAKKYLSRYISEDTMIPSNYLFHREDGRLLNRMILFNLVREVISRAFPYEHQWSRGHGPHVLRHNFLALWIDSGGSCDALEQMSFSSYEIENYAKRRKRQRHLELEFQHFGKELNKKFKI